MSKRLQFSISQRLIFTVWVAGFTGLPSLRVPTADISVGIPVLDTIMQGAIIFFALYSAEGKLFETLDKDMNVLAASSSSTSKRQRSAKRNRPGPAERTTAGGGAAATGARSRNRSGS